MSLKVRLIRIDPFEKRCAILVLDGKTLHREIARNIGAAQLAHHKLTELEDYRILAVRLDGKGGLERYDGGPTPLYAAADAEQAKGQPGWKLKGSDVETVGMSMLFSTGQSGGVSSIPVDLQWLADNLEWVSAEQADAGAPADV